MTWSYAPPSAWEICVGEVRTHYRVLILHDILTPLELENHSVTLVKPPISITPHLVHHLTPESDWKVKHGVVGLLKHLSQSPANRPVIGEAQAIQRLRTCQLFSEKGDMVEVVQMSGINLTKHLCTHNGMFG